MVQRLWKYILTFERFAFRFEIHASVFQVLEFMFEIVCVLTNSYKVSYYGLCTHHDNDSTDWIHRNSCLLLLVLGPLPKIRCNSSVNDVRLVRGRVEGMIDSDIVTLCSDDRHVSTARDGPEGVLIVILSLGHLEVVIEWFEGSDAVVNWSRSHVNSALVALCIEQVRGFVNEGTEELSKFEVAGNVNDILLRKDAAVSDLKVLQGKFSTVITDATVQDIRFTECEKKAMELE